MRRTHFGSPKDALSLAYMYTFAGKMAISNAIIPHAAKADAAGTQSNIPKMISAAPLVILSIFGAGREGGIIFM